MAGILLGIGGYRTLQYFSGAYPSIPTRPIPTALSTLTIDGQQTVATFCAEIDTAWQGSDWPRVIRALQTVKALGAQCTGQDPTAKLYPAYYNYGVSLEATGDVADAMDAYRQALIYNPDGREAELALIQNGALTPEPLPTCSSQHVADVQTGLRAYQPAGAGEFM